MGAATRIVDGEARTRAYFSWRSLLGVTAVKIGHSVGGGTVAQLQITVFRKQIAFLAGASEWESSEQNWTAEPF